MPFHMKTHRYPAFLIIVFLLFLVPVNAHEFWIQPAKYFANAGEVIGLNFFVGEHFKGERWGGGGRRVTTLNYFHHGTVDNLTKSVAYQDSTLNLSVTLAKSGTHAITIATNNSYIELESDKFEAYLKEDGLEHIQEWRASKNKSKEKSREYYQRCARTLIQVGATKDQGYRASSGMVLEIVSQENPYLQKPGAPVHYQILYKNKPLAKALVRFWYRDPAGLVSEEKQRSDDEGKVSFELKKKGEYLVSVVWMEPWLDDNKADVISTWGSLTFAK